MFIFVLDLCSLLSSLLAAVFLSFYDSPKDTTVRLCLSCPFIRVPARYWTGRFYCPVCLANNPVPLESSEAQQHFSIPRCRSCFESGMGLKRLQSFNAERGGTGPRSGMRLVEKRE